MKEYLAVPIRIASSSRHVQALRLAWLLAILYVEVWSLTLAASLRSCGWKDSDSNEESTSSFNLLLLTDPQIADEATNSHLPRLVSSFINWFADQYIRRAYRALIRGSAPSNGKDGLDAVIWMGDLTDGGRREQLLQDDWKSLHNRFDSLINRPLPSSSSSSPQVPPSFFLSGNHDVGLPLAPGQAAGLYSNPLSYPLFLQRYGTPIHDFPGVLKLYVPPNTDSSETLGPSEHKSFNVRMPIFANGNQKGQQPTHEVILIDGQELVGMQRIGGPYRSKGDHTPGEMNGKLREKAKDWHKETFEFVESLKSEKGPLLPRILISHVPLYRPPPVTPQDDFCDVPFKTVAHGIFRTPGSTQKGLLQGTDKGSTFQNLIGPEISEWVLETIQPSLIFSGDDHDHCEVLHTLLYSTQSRFEKEGKLRPKIEMEGFSEDLLRYTTPELTLKAFSVSNPSRPGFGRLSLYSRSREGAVVGPKMSGISYRPCLLPDQLKLSVTVYPILGLLTLGILIWKSDIRRSNGDSDRRGEYEMLGGTETEKEEERRKRLEVGGREPASVSKLSLSQRSENVFVEFVSVGLVAFSMWVFFLWA